MAAARPAPAAEEPAEQLAERPEGDRGHAGREARERQSLAQQDRVHQQIVERRAVAHHVDERPLARELAEMLDGLRPHAHVAEEEVDEEPGERAEALEHGRALRGGPLGHRRGERRQARRSDRLRHQR